MQHDSELLSSPKLRKQEEKQSFVHPPKQPIQLSLDIRPSHLEDIFWKDVEEEREENRRTLERLEQLTQLSNYNTDTIESLIEEEMKIDHENRIERVEDNSNNSNEYRTTSSTIGNNSRQELLLHGLKRTREENIEMEAKLQRLLEGQQQSLLL